MILLDLRQLVWRETSTTRFSRRSRVSKMVADDALDDSTGAVRLRGDMEQLSAWLARAMQEGRAALNSLRTSTPEGNDLLEALKRATESEAIPSSMAVTTQSWANRERCTRSSGTRSIASATRRSSTPVCTRERAALAWSWREAGAALKEGEKCSNVRASIFLTAPVCFPVGARQIAN